jgi:glycosyltransferase involved in cell wall biosynthesis
MIAYHFPPMNQSSGIQRTLRFAQHLPDLGWQPAILTAQARAYPSISQASISEIPKDLHVYRAFALDAAKHLSVRGVYPSWFALPDRWVSWWLGAVPKGISLIRKLKPDVLWSTHPIPTAHLIGYTLHRLTGIRWVADFRDPMAEPGEPEKEYQHEWLEWIERKTLEHCERAVFTTRGALRLYAERYPYIPASRLTVIENGYDESSFAGAEQISPKFSRGDGPLVLLHSGLIYPSARDPRAFFAALGELRRSGAISSQSLRIVLRATGCDDYLRQFVTASNIEDIVTLEPAVPYRTALAEMLGADGLLLLQASNCNYQIPAKVYEYFRARRPILALTDPAGDTAAVLREAGVDTIASLDSAQEIASALMRFVGLLRENHAPVASRAAVAGASRGVRTDELSKVFDSVIATGQ